MKNNKRKSLMLILTAFMILVSWLSSSIQPVKANELDPASKVLCKFDDGREIVRFYSTDYFHYLFRSKSAVTGTQNVETSFLNRFLELAGHDFKKNNEEIMGRPLKVTQHDSIEKTPEEANKEAKKISAFDRFGVSGLNWSSYQGEWKYYHVDSCAKQDMVSPTNFGQFYTDRLEPQSTHNETPTSLDPRTIQFNKSVWSSLLTAFTDIIANGLFTVTKTVVTLTIIFVGLSFTDITTFMGMLSSEGGSKGSAEGVFTSIFNSVFTGFVLLGILATALHILYKGLIKRELRFAFNSLIKTIIIFIIAGIMAFNPAYWVSMPNKITTFGQALVLNSMSVVYGDKTDGSTSLCTTNVAEIQDVKFDLNKPETFKSQFEKTNENMRSMISCNMWQAFLLEPWVKGQFGADYEDLDNGRVRNNNEDWVGTAPVPIGGGKTINNWALFHISTQTNAHVPADGESFPVLINGVNADWWRIVDAMSDYEEKEQIIEDTNGAEQIFNVPVKKETTEFWQSWVGNNRTERLGIALISIFFGIVGSIAPLVFGIASAVFGLGLTLLMMTSPVFFLFGVIGGEKGNGVFFGWLEALVNTMIKKIAAGLLLILSLSFSLAIIKMINEIGFIQSFILMVVTSTLLVKNKDKLFSVIANVNFGGAFDPRQKANQFMDMQKSSVKEVTKTTFAAVGGSVAAHQTGQNAFRGALLGTQRQLMNKMYTSTTGMHLIREVDSRMGSGKQTCITCHYPLTEGIAYRDDNGNYYCKTCSEEAGLENLYEVVVGKDKTNDVITRLVGDKSEVITNKDVRSIKSTSGLSEMSHKQMKNESGQIEVDGENMWEEDNVQRVILENLDNLQRDFIVFKNVHARFNRRANIPSTPQPLQEYIDLPLINMAWEQERLDIIERTYKEAWKMWYRDNAQHIAGTTDEEIEEFEKMIEEQYIDIDSDEATMLLDDYFKNHMRVDDRAADAPIYEKRNGVIRLYNTDIADTDDRLK